MADDLLPRHVLTETSIEDMRRKWFGYLVVNVCAERYLAAKKNLIHNPTALIESALGAADRARFADARALKAYAGSAQSPGPQAAACPYSYGHAAPGADVQVTRACAQHSDRTALQIDPVDAENGHCGDFIRDHVEDNAALAECGGVATRALVRVTDGLGVVFQVFDSGVKGGAQEAGQLA